MLLMPHLVLFARYPQWGRGKTRLAAGAGASIAIRFQRTMLSHLLHRLAGDARWRTVVAITPHGIGRWSPHIEVLPQGRGDLGVRLRRASRGLLPGPAIIIGTDCPAIRPNHIVQGFAALKSHDAVIGPSADGGYWLIGLRQPQLLDPFARVRWSSVHTLDDTMDNLKGRRVALLEQMEDIDEVDRLSRAPNWARLNAGSVPSATLETLIPERHS